LTRFKIGSFVAVCLNEGFEVMPISGTRYDGIILLWEKRIARYKSQQALMLAPLAVTNIICQLYQNLPYFLSPLFHISIKLNYSNNIVIYNSEKLL
jgi:hypothetical protein